MADAFANPQLPAEKRSFGDVAELLRSNTTSGAYSPTVIDLSKQSLLGELLLGGEPALVISGLLTEEESAAAINESEAAGYESLEHLYHPGYRSNDRVILFDKTVAQCLFERLSPHLPHASSYTNFLTRRLEGMPAEERPEVRADRCNDCFRMCRYGPSGVFRPHSDGSYGAHHEERSLLTVNIYLNGGFKDGCTRFLASVGRIDSALQQAKERNEAAAAAGKPQAVPEDVIQQLHALRKTAMAEGRSARTRYAEWHSVTPAPGTAVVFHHDLLHDGQPVGTEWMPRDGGVGDREALAPEPAGQEASPATPAAGWTVADVRSGQGTGKPIRKYLMRSDVIYTLLDEER